MVSASLPEICRGSRSSTASILAGREVVVEVVVDLHGGRPAAGADALDFFQRKQAVRRDAFVADAEGVLAVVEQLKAAAQHAGNVRADLHVVLAGGHGAQHGVVAEDVAHVELEQVEALCDLGDHVVGDVADLVLRVEQHGDQGRTLERIDRGQLVKAGGRCGGEDRVW